MEKLITLAQVDFTNPEAVEAFHSEYQELPVEERLVILGYFLDEIFDYDDDKSVCESKNAAFIKFSRDPRFEADQRSWLSLIRESYPNGEPAPKVEGEIEPYQQVNKRVGELIHHIKNSPPG